MEFFKNPVAKWLSKVIDYKNHVIIGLLGLAGVILATTLYSLYQDSCEKQSHRTWVEVQKYVNAKVSPQETFSSSAAKVFKTKEEKLQAIVDVCQKAYQANKRTSFAPFFLTTLSDASLSLGKTAQSLEALNQALGQIRSPFIRQAYEMKRALVMLDSTEAAVAQEGLALLKGIADQEHHPLHDYALYQLGNYYWAAKDFAQVKNYWKMLLLKYVSAAGSPSPWVGMVKDNLALIEG